MHWVAWIALAVFVFLLSYDPKVGTVQRFLASDVSPKISPEKVDGKA
jgi:hypothetical protein